MKSTNFDYSGGFPFDQSTLKRLQEALFEHIRTFANQLGCQDTGNYILYGCDVVGSNITPGVMYIDGEICPFAGAVGDGTTKIKKQTNTTNAAFENGTNPPVFIETIAVVNALGLELQNFTRFHYVQDQNYVHTDNNFTALLLAKLNGIETGAEVNVQADWNVTNPASDAFIKNKPQILNVIKIGSVILDDFPNASSETRNITFSDVGTSNYIVLGSMESRLPFAAALPDLIVWTTSGYSPTSFRLLGRELGSGTQNLKFNYILIGI